MGHVEYATLTKHIIICANLLCSELQKRIAAIADNFVFLNRSKQGGRQVRSRGGQTHLEIQGDPLRNHSCGDNHPSSFTLFVDYHDAKEVIVSLTLS